MRGDTEEADELQKQLDELDKVLGAGANGSAAQDESATDLLAMVNERNRKANLEAVRKAEAEAAERKRKERKARFLAAQAQKRMQKLGQQGGSTPGTPGAANG
jgi:RNA polymerase-associated protein RTF1